MGVDMHLYLPHETRVSDVATVLAILAGEKPEKRDLGRGSYAAWARSVRAKYWDHAAGGSFEGEGLIPWITFHRETRDPLGNATLLLSASAGGGDGEMLLEHLAAFFGGLLSYSDCADDEERGNTAVWRRPRGDNAPEDGAAWHAFQDELLALEPLPLRGGATVTRYALDAAPDVPPFASAVEAICYALERGLSPNWRPVVERPPEPPAPFDPLVVASVLTGDLFLVDSDGRTSFVAGEDDLHDREELATRHASVGSPLLEGQGGEWSRVALVPCADCRGSGREVASAWFAEDPDSGGMNYAHCAEHETLTWRQQRGLLLVEEHEHACCRCEGERSYADVDYTDERGTLAELVEKHYGEQPRAAAGGVL